MYIGSIYKFISYHMIYSLFKSIKYLKKQHSNIKQVRELDSKAPIETLTAVDRPCVGYKVSVVFY